MMRCAFLVILALVATTGSASGQQPDLYDETALRTFELTFAQQNYWQLLLQNKASKTCIKADLKVDGITYKDVGVRFRGNSSYGASAQKKPFRISLDEFVPGQKLHGVKTINLNNAMHDPTYTRTALAFWVLRQFMPAPRVNWVKLTLNGQNWGVYENVEQVNKDLLDGWFADDDGNRYKAEPGPSSPPQNSALLWLGTNTTLYQLAYELKNENAVTPWTDLMTLCDKLNNSGAQITTELPKHLDVDSALRYLVGINLLPAIDSYIHGAAHNFYLYNDPTHARFSIVPWDMNNSLGAYPFMPPPQAARLDPLYRATDPVRPLLSKLLLHQAWRERYLAHYRSALARWFDWNMLGAKVTQWQALIRAEVAADPIKLYPLALFDQNVTRDVNLGFAVAGLQPFITSRSQFLKNHAFYRRPAPSLSGLTQTPAQPTVNDKVWITAKVAQPRNIVRLTLHHRATGVFVPLQMFDDGQHQDGQAGDGVFGQAISAQPHGARIEYYVEAENAQAAGSTVAFLPDFAAFKPGSYTVSWPRGKTNVWINEFVAKNVNGIRDEKGEREDWIELVNPGKLAVDLSGMHLTDDLSSPTKWKLPAGTRLDPGKVLLVWADDEPDGPLHATFKLDKDGEEVALFDTDGVTLLDSIVFGPQQPDVATARLFDGQTPWVTFATPTPFALNAPAACGARSYSALDPPAHRMTLSLAGTPKIDAAVTFQATNGPANNIFFLAASTSPLRQPLADGVDYLVAPPFLFVLPLASDGNGSANLPLTVPDAPSLVGQRFYWQVIAHDGAAFQATNALETTICTK